MSSNVGLSPSIYFHYNKIKYPGTNIIPTNFFVLSPLWIWRLSSVSFVTFGIFFSCVSHSLILNCYCLFWTHIPWTLSLNLGITAAHDILKYNVGTIYSQLHFILKAHFITSVTTLVIHPIPSRKVSQIYKHDLRDYLLKRHFLPFPFSWLKIYFPPYWNHFLHI